MVWRKDARLKFSVADPSASHNYDCDLHILQAGSRLKGWQRLKIKNPHGDISRVALEARLGNEVVLSFEVVCRAQQFRCYVYLAATIEILTIKISGAGMIGQSAIDFRPISAIEYLWKSWRRGLFAQPKKFLSYFLKPLDPFLVTFAFPQPSAISDRYQWWIANSEGQRVHDLLASRAEVTCDVPDVAILMTVCDPNPGYLKKAIESVYRQSSPKWTLSIADDASANPEIREILKAAGRDDSRVTLKLREQRGNISAATNDAFAAVSAPLTTCLDHDDTLSRVAIEASALHFARHGNCGLLFSDEDKIDEWDNRFAVYFKPRRFSPELYFSYNYINHMTVHRSETIRKVGGWRTEFDGAQDYDIVLRSIKAIGLDAIHHLPLVLYHWRAIAGSAALDVSYKLYAIEKGRLALADYFGHRAEDISVVDQTMYRVRYALPTPLPLVSVLVPFRDRSDLLRSIVASVLERTDYPNLELLLIDNGSVDPDTLAFISELKTKSRIRVIRDDAPFNYSRLNNMAVAEARGEYLCFLNNDIEVIEPDWLRDMIGYASQPDVGCVGAKLYYPNGSVQHAGVVLGMGGIAGHAFLNAQPDSPGYFGRLRVASNYSAVTGACLAVRKSTYLKVGGMDASELSVAFNDVDLCIKTQAAGLRNVWTPFARLKHWESASRGAETSPEKIARFSKECKTMMLRHHDILRSDPFYSAHLTLQASDFSIRTEDESFLFSPYEP